MGVVGVIGLVVIGGIAFLLGVAVIIGASDDLHRECDDREQEEYLRRWAEKQKKKKQARCR
jgi:hypothetical protein